VPAAPWGDEQALSGTGTPPQRLTGHPSRHPGWAGGATAPWEATEDRLAWGCGARLG
jgi:hypothetical protein